MTEQQRPDWLQIMALSLTSTRFSGPQSPTSKSGTICPDSYMQAKASASFIAGVKNGENEVQRRECLAHDYSIRILYFEVSA